MDKFLRHHIGAAYLALWKQAGRIAAIIWITLPAIGLGSFLISTYAFACTLVFRLLSICGIATQKYPKPLVLCLLDLRLG